MFRLTRSTTNQQAVDPFNLDNKRNVHNTNKRSYNCAGYALNTFSWYYPRHNRSSSRSFEFNNNKECVQKTKKSVEIMLADFPDLRVITSVSELMPDEYAIAFRHSSDGDFHYAKLGRNGIWYDKKGNTNWIDILYKEQFQSKWNFRYDGVIVLFAKKFPIDNK